MHLTIDFETRSKVDLKKRGMYVYAEDESTDVLCLALKVDHNDPVIWVPHKFRYMAEAAFVESISDDELLDIIYGASMIEAHNLGFELCIWENVMTKRYGFPMLDVAKCQCSAAKAAAMALPRSLGEACFAMRLTQQKDKKGYGVMLRMCKPKRNGEWNESPSDFKLLVDYCKQDTNAEYELSQSLPDLSPAEREVWLYDWRINSRGVKVDLPAINKIVDKVQAKESRLLLEIQEITGGRVKSVRQRNATLDWLDEQEVVLEDLTKASVSEALKDLSEGAAKRLLEIRQSLGKSSVAKFAAMQRFACNDSYVRGSLLYHAATTGRWGGKGVQVQNLPRDSFDDSGVEDIINLDSDLIEMLYGCVMQASSKCLRGMFVADEGNALMAADYSAIEARVLAWLAGEEKDLEAFRSGKDIYKVAAEGIYDKKYEAITKDERQIGKVAVLALGYQGWIGAFDAMAAVYGVNVPEDQAKEIILAWRESHPMVVKFWSGIEDAALQAVKTGRPYAYGRIKFGVRSGFLHCRLPSGRLLSYPFPSVKKIVTKYGQEKEVVSFWGVDSYSGKWCEQMTYGGKLTENIDQALSRDILASAIIRIEKENIPVRMHIHDELVAEVPEKQADLESFSKLMSVVPEWAQGLPLEAAGYVAKRYRK